MIPDMGASPTMWKPGQGKGHPSFVDETGNRHGKLVVEERGTNGPRGNARWWCLCDCGQRVLVEGIRLRVARSPVRDCGGCEPRKAPGRRKPQDAISVTETQVRVLRELAEGEQRYDGRRAPAAKALVRRGLAKIVRFAPAARHGDVVAVYAASEYGLAWLGERDRGAD